MRTITVENQQVDIYNIYDFPYNLLRNLPIVEKKNKRYLNIINTFDIETTNFTKEECNVVENDFAFMYVWQACFNGIVVMGRTWEEYIQFINNVKETVNIGKKKEITVIVYIHNLSFEFQFMRNFFHVDNIFATEKRKLLYAVMDDIEYRCSYRLTNMSLDKFTQKTKGVTFIKQDGEDFDYKVKRYPTTELTEKELGYCVCDVLGLWQGLCTFLEEDNLATIPLTSTGFVRRDYREACLQYPGYRNEMLSKRLNEHTYLLCREASRGAISGANHLYVDETIEDVDSQDIKSSYPFQMATKYFPKGKFIKFDCHNHDSKFQKLLDNKCCLIVWSCRNLKLKKWACIPYISKAKCRAIEDFQCGNGKVYSAKRIGMCCTEIDYKIIMEKYYCEDIVIHEIWACDRGMLPYPFRKHLMDMFQKKTDLEDGDKFMYNKYKNKINASFGMMLTDILHEEIEYVLDDEECWKSNEITDIESALDTYYKNKNSFLNYQDGVWVLAHARSDLVKGMNVTKEFTIQCDTDSVKSEGSFQEGFDEINKKIMEKAESYDIKPYAYKNGKKVYLGIWEHEGKPGEYTYKYFRTLGAKKYCNTDENGHLVPTVAGLNKGAGWWIEHEGGLDYFTNGSIFPAYVEGKKVSGRTCAYYYDRNDVITVSVCGHKIVMGSSVCIRDIEYTLGMTSEWMMLALEGKGDRFAPTQFGAFKGWLE